MIEMERLDDQTRWQAVAARDAAFDGRFVLGVVTTGIYCRPSCPARRPKRDNVRFFDTPADAEAAGFRACKRCRPQAVAHEAEMVERLVRYIDTHLDGDLTLAALAAHVGYSPFHLQRLFKRAVGMSPREYARASRIDRLKDGLKADTRVTDAIYEAGFQSNSAAYDVTASALGMEPSTYQRGGQGETIRYTVVDCSLGRLLVGATERGIAAVSLADTDEPLDAFVRGEFPAAEIVRDDMGLRRWVGEVVAQVEGEPPHNELPLDIRATAFQRRVWDALRQIPPGETRTYSEVARAIGQPTAVRAVAHACATNRIAVMIPCHRVIREDGSLGGYRWGLERKAVLLQRERDANAD
jgi:AraC family transcriptional regulator of adaptative response/methylated-DNA-[protein]-cysteine methyltransferase